MKRFFLIALTLVIAVGVASQLRYLIPVLELRDHNPDDTAFMERAREHGAVRYEWRDYEQIADDLKRAVLISEDARFMEHIGFDWRGIRHAIERNEEAGRPVAGGSTVTQQLAKNLFLSSEKSYARKIQEALIALMLEATLSKKRILELYLNTAQWGNRLFGAQAAARHYFDVDAQTLSPAQAAQLAVLLPRPSYYDVRGTTVYVEQRTLWIQKQLPLVRIPPP
ncbi:MAG: monofunctional biosynthetic peptidoglycan transglycosylase [Alcanivorax sp.]|mgnify:FL=1|jgi:monofunctional glycosyltransferase|uniref:Biosynthetic peptidoglycan transglycosylase n=1 Tax=Alloalcanivorax venustensis ISO4 TaxID=1177184 RepID=A0ABS0ACA8_9GAMM|nr:monofunctional biosynthetic peptidoglycan transglycosylase [Alloalcanivorax venustensis]MAQ35540.1 monofunctional biosynthetic peptidoglycan transglycosylase [Alcanivorax sp.]MEA3261245.1 monofunctional biosynthetic peptidoglycan transglycosylase [Pseudomonadota bacterium]SMO53626.1 monofunctional biosynthetic peptidoglycan transglycosylase [Alcanivorax sp. DSM 26295]MBD3651908.1 monofunctional biosynthetic peptidoglycan transglycosylase [Alcanivorax sp.]MBF5051713.1 peptidoglycantransglyco|tara:strand:+ start:60433 stop:61104 length:672 start_codon:yes stop_codon:yes gene_type:complete